MLKWFLIVVAAALWLGLGMYGTASAQANPCPQSTPGFTAGGTVFGANSAQFNAYFGAKLDATSTALGCLLANTVTPGVTSVSAGCGVTAAPNPISGAGSIKLGPGEDLGPTATNLSPAYVEFDLDASLTSSITWTLPSAAAVGKYCRVAIVDRVGGITGGYSLFVAPFGTDTINGRQASVALSAAYGGLALESDGVSKWAVVSNLWRSCQNILAYGGDPTFTNDNSAAYAAAIAAYSPPCVYFPAGRYKFVGTNSYSYPANNTPTAITLKGDGEGMSVLDWPSGVPSNSCALSFTQNGTYQGLHIQDLSVRTGGTTGSGICGTVSYNSVTPAYGYSSPSYLTRIGVSGEAGLQDMTHYWGDSSISLTAMSNVNFYGVYTNNGAAYANNSSEPGGAGVSIIGATTSLSAPYYAVVFNFSNSAFNNAVNGLSIGGLVQGIALSNTNITGGFTCIGVPPGETALDELSIVTSQFNCAGFDLNILSTFLDVSIAGASEFIAPTQGLHFAAADNSTKIQGATIRGSLNAGSVGISLTGTGGLVTNNTIVSYAVGLQMLGTNAIARDDTYVTNGVNFTSAGPTNQVYDSLTSASVNYATVSGAVGNGGSPALVRLTVSSTANFVSGQMVMVSGVGGVGTIASSAIITPINVVDGTHMDLEDLQFSGSYTSGGFVSSVP